MKKIRNIPREDIRKMKAGESFLFSGLIYTARDQAHKKLAGLIERGRKLPLSLKDKIIYYCGPTKAAKGKVIGSCGPTTSSRMDEFTPLLLKKGVMAVIGKGNRSEEVAKAIRKYKAVYFLTYAGCGALLSKSVKKSRLVAFKDFGPEAVFELEVEDFPLIIGIDSKGKNVYKRTGTK